MNWKVACLLAICGLSAQTRNVDACGTKLTISTPSPRRAVAHTSNPSEILLLGDPPSRLKRDLSAAGHHVEVAATPSDAKQKGYAVVIVDASMQDGARSTFPNSVVVVRSGDVDRDVHSVENIVARRPIQVGESRTVVAARTPRVPIAAGPPQTENRRLVEAKPEPKPEVVPIERTEVSTSKPEPKATETTVAVETKPAVTIKAHTMVDEVYFSLGASTLAHKTLDKAVDKLKNNPDLQVTVEGYADPTGNHDDNMILSQKRAEWVRDYLVSAGIDQSRLEVSAYGDTLLKYGATDGRNRRVAVVAK